MNKTPQNIVFNLTPEEQAWENETGRVELPRTDPIYKQIQQAATESLAQGVPVHLRLPKNVIQALKQKAQNEGLTYQSLIRSILYKYATQRALKEI